MSVSSENRGLQTWTDLSALPCHIVHDFNLLKDDVTMTPPPSVWPPHFQQPFPLLHGIARSSTQIHFRAAILTALPPPDSPTLPP